MEITGKAGSGGYWRGWGREIYIPVCVAMEEGFHGDRVDHEDPLR